MSQAAAERDESTFSRDIERDIDDMLKALRSVGRSGGTVVNASGNALERELDMAIRLSEEIRDSVINPATLAEARQQRFHEQLRADAHRLIDIIADFGGVAALQMVRFADGFLGSRRAATTAVEETAAET
jgi:hypothetical protein